MELSRDATQILMDASVGDPAAAEELLPIVYDELRRLARSYLRREQSGHTLQTTALVHEAYLRLVDQTRVRWENQAHFLGVAAIAMRRILVNHAKARRRLKREGDRVRIALTDAVAGQGDKQPDLIALDEALDGLAAMDARQARIVELRFFGGLTVDETARVLNVSPRTVKREWLSARAWLHGKLEE